MVTKTETTKTEIKPDNVAPAGTTADANAPAGQDLSIADLKNLGTIIDVASTRGAFRAGEMATVGAMYNKLQAFINTTYLYCGYLGHTLYRFST